MKNIKYIFFSFFILIGCNKKVKEKTESKITKNYTTISYLDLKLEENGHLPSNPYILEFKNGKKEIVFCGVEHLTNNSDI